MVKHLRNIATVVLGGAAVVCFGIAGHYPGLLGEFAVSGWVLIVATIAVAVM